MNPTDNLSNALRPAFTEKTLGWLAQGKTINVFGEEGQGIGRLVDDLATNCPSAVQFVRLSMRSFADSYAGFLQALADALDITLAPSADIRIVLTNFLGASKRKLWLCLEHFDRLADQQVNNKLVDTQGYDLHFLNYLNSLKNTSRVSLLVCSRREIRAQELYIGGKPVPGSKLEFSEREPLPTLTFAEIEACLAQRAPDSPQKTALFATKPPFYTLLVTEIHAHPKAADFAYFVAAQPIDPTWDMNAFQERLLFWKKQFTKQHAPTLDRQFGHVEKWSRLWLRRAGRVLNIGKIWNKIGLTMKITFILLTSLALGGWKWLAQAWAFIASFFHQ